MLVDMEVCLQHTKIFQSQAAIAAFSFEPKRIVFLIFSEICYSCAETVKIALRVYN